MGSIISVGLGLLKNPGAILGLLKNPFIIALAFLAWTAYQRHDAAKQATDKCENAQLKADMAELARQLAARDALLKTMRARADATEAEIESLEKERDAIVAELQAAPKGDQCILDPALRKRLLNIT